MDCTLTLKLGSGFIYSYPLGVVSFWAWVFRYCLMSCSFCVLSTRDHVNRVLCIQNMLKFVWLDFFLGLASWQAISTTCVQYLWKCRLSSAILWCGAVAGAASPLLVTDSPEADQRAAGIVSLLALFSLCLSWCFLAAVWVGKFLYGPSAFWHFPWVWRWAWWMESMRFSLSSYKWRPTSTLVLICVFQWQTLLLSFACLQCVCLLIFPLVFGLHLAFGEWAVWAGDAGLHSGCHPCLRNENHWSCGARGHTDGHSHWHIISLLFWHGIAVLLPQLSGQRKN